MTAKPATALGPIAASSLALVGMVAVGPSAATAPQDRIVTSGSRHYHVSQIGTGTPPVVFESGVGEDLSTWSDVQPAVAGLVRAFSYDRAGIGRSDAVPSTGELRTVLSMVEELHELLRAASLSGPYVLVGHSLGGALVQVYAHAYPSDIAGLVLVDPEDSRLVERLHAQTSAEEWAARERAIAQALSSVTEGIRLEMDIALKTSGTYTARATPLPNVPTVLLTGTKKDPTFPGNPLEQDLKMEMHKALLSTLPRGRQILAPKSRHYIQNDSPELVIDAIRSVVNEARRSGRPARRPA